jgi:hypothetical protein
MGGGDQIGVVGKPKIIISTEVDGRTPGFQGDGPGLWTGDGPFGLVKARIFQAVQFACQMLDEIVTPSDSP